MRLAMCLMNRMFVRPPAPAPPPPLGGSGGFGGPPEVPVNCCSVVVADADAAAAAPWAWSILAGAPIGGPRLGSAPYPGCALTPCWVLIGVPSTE